MKIVIEIPDELYNSVLNETYCGSLYEELKNGIVLPKGHGDLIDRNMCLAMKSRDLVDADGVTMYAVPTGNILRIDAVIPADTENSDLQKIEWECEA